MLFLSIHTYIYVCVCNTGEYYLTEWNIIFKRQIYYSHNTHYLTVASNWNPFPWYPG